MADSKNEKPGEGIRSMRSTTAFRVVNFELYAKPNIVIMSIALLLLVILTNKTGCSTNMDSAALSSAIAKFSLQFCNELDKSKSVVSSPMSAEILLALLTLGSSDPAHGELLNAIGFKDDDSIRSSFSAVTSKLKSVKGVTLQVANKVYLQNGFDLDPKLKHDAIEIFDSDLEPLDFSNSGAAAKLINDWLLEMPYEGGEASMVIILPKEVEGINDLLKSLATDVDLVQELNQMHPIKVQVTIPKFKIETEIDLKTLLPKKAFIEVNEEGAEAAAATAMNIAMCCAMVDFDPVKVFLADRPFLAVIQKVFVMFSALKKLARSNDERCTAPVPMSSSLQKKFSRGVHFNMKILIKGDRNVGKSCLLQRLQGGPFIEEYVPTDQIQVEVWEVVDKGRTKKKSPLGLKLENQSAAVTQDEAYETPVLDATFLDVYKNATGVILMLDITKPWTFEYVVKELSRVPADLPVVILGNHCDMQHHRQFLSVPFLRLQRTSLLEQLQRNQKDMEEAEKEMDDFQLAQSLNPMGIKAQHGVQSQFVSPELLKRPARSDDNETTNPKVTVEQDDVELDYNAMVQDIVSEQTAIKQEEARLEETFARQVSVHNDSTSKSELAGSDHSLQVSMENEFPLWAGDARRSPEGGEDPDVAKETNAKPEKKPKKKKSKSKDKGDCSEKSEKKEKKHKHKKSKSEKKTTNPQSALLEPTPIDNFYSEDDYDSI
ncbi:hypothetical protein MSG28_000325 [Choristoneura fumiferana]|uniref:Uncharacterized protein n=1 Tax=Choristoneura fumiferana TaxID=7141 RepID=A0ACC0K034_CHOFU|nr:hypothetical protein MSG28_000325 [Choristoneura fumiferana]